MKNNYLPAVFVSLAFLIILASSFILAEEQIPYWGLTHTANYADLATGVTQELNVLQRIQFQIDGKYSHVGVVNLDQTKGTVGIEVINPVQRATLIVDKPREFDITGDDMSDIRVKLNGVSNNLANITLSFVPAGESRNVSAIQDEDIPLTGEGVFVKLWVLAVIALVLIIIAVGFWILKKRK
jgi:hypothetical protein